MKKERIVIILIVLIIGGFFLVKSIKSDSIALSNNNILNETKKEDKINSISAFKLALEKDPENPFYNNSLAYAYSKAELYDDAIEHYQKAIAINPDNEWTSIVCEALGSIYAEAKGNIDAAVSTYQAGIILDPNYYNLLISLGDVHMAAYDLDNAIRAYCDAITLNTDDYRAYSKAGISLCEKDYQEEALVAFH